jgi:hypothetical protein
MKIYTSYHAKYSELKRNGIVPVNISIQHPKFITETYHAYKSLMPTYPMLKMSQRDYDIHFNAILNRTTQSKVVNDLSVLGSRVALCCYEKDHTVCHRSKVASWLREGGYSVEEYEPPKSSQLLMF